MFQTIFNAFAGRHQLKSIITAGAVLASLAGVPTAVLARPHGFHIDVVVPGPPIVLPCAPVMTATQVWVAPVYQTVSQNVWIPDVTTTQMQRVVVPARYSHREVLRVDFLGIPHLHRDAVLVRPACVEERPVTLVVTPGHYEVQACQVLVCQGHWALQR